MAFEGLKGWHSRRRRALGVAALHGSDRGRNAPMGQVRLSVSMSEAVLVTVTVSGEEEEKAYMESLVMSMKSWEGAREGVSGLLVRAS